MWGKGAFGQIPSICVMLNTCFVFGLWNPSMCRVVALEGPEYRQHRAYSVIIVDTRNCIRRCLGGQSIFEQDRVCVVLSQNHSANWLGLNPAGLTMWEEH